MATQRVISFIREVSIFDSLKAAGIYELYSDRMRSLLKKKQRVRR